VGNVCAGHTFSDKREKKMIKKLIVFGAVLSLGILVLNNPVHSEEKGSRKIYQNDQ